MSNYTTFEKVTARRVAFALQFAFDASQSVTIHCPTHVKNDPDPKSIFLRETGEFVIMKPNAALQLFIEKAHLSPIERLLAESLIDHKEDAQRFTNIALHGGKEEQVSSKEDFLFADIKGSNTYMALTFGKHESVKALHARGKIIVRISSKSHSFAEYVVCASSAFNFNKTLVSFRDTYENSVNGSGLLSGFLSDVLYGFNIENEVRL